MLGTSIVHHLSTQFEYGTEVRIRHFGIFGTRRQSIMAPLMLYQFYFLLAARLATSAVATDQQVLTPGDQETLYAQESSLQNVKHE